MNTTLLAADIVRRVKNSPDSPLNDAEMVRGLIEAELKKPPGAISRQVGAAAAAYTLIEEARRLLNEADLRPEAVDDREAAELGRLLAELAAQGRFGPPHNLTVWQHAAGPGWSVAAQCSNRTRLASGPGLTAALAKLRDENPRHLLTDVTPASATGLLTLANQPAARKARSLHAMVRHHERN